MLLDSSRIAKKKKAKDYCSIIVYRMLDARDQYRCPYFSQLKVVYFPKYVPLEKIDECPFRQTQSQNIGSKEDRNRGSPVDAKKTRYQTAVALERFQFM